MKKLGQDTARIAELRKLERNHRMAADSNNWWKKEADRDRAEENLRDVLAELAALGAETPEEKKV